MRTCLVVIAVFVAVFLPLAAVAAVLIAIFAIAADRAVPVLQPVAITARPRAARLAVASFRAPPQG